MRKVSEEELQGIVVSVRLNPVDMQKLQEVLAINKSHRSTFIRETVMNYVNKILGKKK